MFARGAMSLISEDEDPAKRITLGFFHISFENNPPLDLRERDYSFVTLPSLESGASVTLVHELDWNRIFRYEKRRTKEGLVPGERFQFHISERRGRDIIWWCWGDLESDLKDMKFHPREAPDDGIPFPRKRIGSLVKAVSEFLLKELHTRH
ncbi:hypothetical protein F4678DRAFT_420501 [Xylaria arbuscula]|nr:hypothetical protein F4678DRAFT_420501 [Xylaria arbuscula]